MLDQKMIIGIAALVLVIVLGAVFFTRKEKMRNINDGYKNYVFGGLPYLMPEFEKYAPHYLEEKNPVNGQM